MNGELANYRVLPSVVQKGVKTNVLIFPLGEHAHFEDESGYTVTLIPMDICNGVAPFKEGEVAKYDVITTKPKNGSISFTYTFENEQEWVIKIEKPESDFCKKFYIYSLSSDLYELSPYKGDLHIHTSRSDGREEPAIVAANYRKKGFDFIAITDHHRWEPSKEAMDKYKDMPINLKLFFGEEVHVPTGHIHSVNFGGGYSINSLYHDNKSEYDAEIEQYAKSIDVPDGINSLEFAYRKWIHENIKKSGGLSIYVHPFWISRDIYHVQSNMAEYILEAGCYDAFEVLNSGNVQRNNMQVALYHDQRAAGKKIPIVGSSDSHGTEPPRNFDAVKTIVFSKDLELDSICGAIKGLLSVAVEGFSKEDFRVYGPLRLVKYTRFLMERYFPIHDELCIEEGLLMKDYICGNKQAPQLLKGISNRVDEFANAFFGKAI
ncbi:MAG: hypothetical protein M0R40_01690 [Firmicutes bacterium]|nr:hypothetical protein [Bacillota bacterium]